MKKIYSDADKSDLPLESSSISKSLNKVENGTSKAKISVISSKNRTKKDENKKAKVDAKRESLRTKLSSDTIDAVDLEKLNEEKIQNHSFRAKRNMVIIVILSILLAITVAIIAIYASTITKRNNCFVYSYGDTYANYIIDGKEVEEFRTPPNIKGNSIFSFYTDIYIVGTETYDIKFSIDVYESGVLLNNTLVYEPNLKLFTRDSDGFYHSKLPIQGGQTINLCQGVILDRQYENSLNANNIEIKFNTYFEKV
ncbi:MAG: hypothetical protein IKM43_04370 [Clostridia bacterium]|nr:hypothetical protein [Clostridia bacterium]